MSVHTSAPPRSTAAAEEQRYRLPDGYIPQHTLEEVRAFVATFPWGLEHMFSSLPPALDLTGKRILDLGCGVTLQALELVEKHHVGEYHGIDPDRDTFYGGHNNYDAYMPYKHSFTFYYPERVNFYYSIAEEMPFPDDYFDFAFASQTTEHVQDAAAMCRELRRVLKPGAYFFATHHNFYAWDGHHQGPYFIKDLPNATPEQLEYQHWKHLEMDRDWSEPHHLNRIMIRELEAAVRESLRVVTWHNHYTQPERGLTFLTQEILRKYEGRYDYEDLATTMVEILAKNEKQ